ncbi:MAG: polysaccharide deacetylase family protein [Planctomycetaceae bacterium]
MNETGWITLTFDDALDQHLDVVLPALDTNGLVGTFYVPLSARGFVRRQDEWRAAALSGHELGNHTVFHPALSSKAWVQPGNAIDDYSLDRMRMELEFANEMLSAVDGQPERTFAYPCSNPCVGHSGWVRAALRRLNLDRTRLAGWVDRFQLDVGSTRESYARIVGELFPAARGGGLSRGAVVPPTSQWERTNLLSVAVEGWELSELQRHVEAAVSRQTWGILQFHGVGGGHHMDCDASVFREFAAWLGDRHPLCVKTVLEGVRRLWPDCSSSTGMSSSAVLSAKSHDSESGFDDYSGVQPSRDAARSRSERAGANSS